MLSTVQHPVLGRLVPDQWNRGLLTFRQFPHMRMFWHPDPEKTIARLSVEQRRWVTGWDRHAAELSPICRNFDVLAALQSLGVYEVSIGVPRTGELSAPQVAAYQWFLDHEEAVCGNVIGALLRYYRHMRQVAPDWFRDDDYPNGHTVEELAPLLRFDGIGISRRSSHGLSVITMGWDPDWDPEHGLGTTLYRDQVLEIGQSAETVLLLDPEEYLTGGYSLWGPNQLNDAEQAVLQEFVEGYEYREGESVRDDHT